MKKADLAVKVLFEVTPEGKMTNQIEGMRSGIMAGLMTVVKAIADEDKVEMEDILNEMIKANRVAKANPLADLLFGHKPSQPKKESKPEEENGMAFEDFLDMILGGAEHDCDNCDKYDECESPNKTAKK